MQHLEDGYLHEIADGEVPSDELVAVREHLDACESCRARLDQARMEAETARELVELIDVPELAVAGAVSDDSAAMFAAPMRLAEMEFSSLSIRSPVAAEPPRPKSTRWMRPLAWAASLILAAGIGYASRSDSYAALSSRIEPTSIGRIDTVYLDIPAETPQPEANELDGIARDALNRTKNLAAAPPAEPPRSDPAVPARQNAAGARAEEEQSIKRRAGLDTAVRADEAVAMKVSEKKAEDPKDADAKLQEGLRERAANDTRDQARQLRSSRPQPAAPSVAGATAEGRLLAKSAADAAPTVVSFQRAIELLGGRLKLIEGMVPARLEAMGRTVRVIYLIDEGDLVLAQVAAPDSVNWALSGPLTADSLVQLRLRVR